MSTQQSSIPNERKLAVEAWAAGDFDAGRMLYRTCINLAASIGEGMSPAFYLAEWARMEAMHCNREAFDSLFNEAIELEPNAPLLRLLYARDLWTEFKDRTECLTQIEALEELLKSERWNKAIDLSPLAYSQKIETLIAWTRGEEGGHLQP